MKNNLLQFTKKGKFLMLALDHRESLKKIINPKNPSIVTDEEIIKTKQEIITYLKNQISGLLIDADWGLPAYKKAKAKNPFLLAIEKSGYQEIGDDRLTVLQYLVRQLKKLGASGVKLLIYFNPFSSTAAAQINTVRQVFLDCQAEEIPFFLEIVTYHTDRSIKKNTNLVVESIKRFLAESIRPDVFKLEYPGNEKACGEVTYLLKNRPWILLTRGENFEIFKHQLAVAVKNGCQGFLAGRALWKELGKLFGQKRRVFLELVIKERFKEIAEIVLNS